MASLEAKDNQLSKLHFFCPLLLCVCVCEEPLALAQNVYISRAVAALISALLESGGSYSDPCLHLYFPLK